MRCADLDDVTLPPAGALVDCTQQYVNKYIILNIFSLTLTIYCIDGKPNAIKTRELKHDLIYLMIFLLLFLLQNQLYMPLTLFLLV